MIFEANSARSRVDAGTFDELAAGAARRWMDHTDRGQSVALVAETNEHVDALNLAVQQQRRLRGHLGEHTVHVAGDETASVGDVVVTRRNDRTTRTDRGEPVRNRDRWTVVGVDPNGSLTVSYLNGHGTTTLAADYARHHVRLGYAATAHGHQGDTVDIGLAVVTQATSHRSLYVGATRGRQENRLLVVTDDTAPEAALEVLERVLTNDRADVPAVIQRRNLAHLVLRARTAEDPVTVARRNLGEVRRSVRAYLRPLAAAQSEARAADTALQEQRAALADAPRWRRRGMTAQLRAASDALEAALSKVDELELLAAPHTARVDAAEQDLRQAEHDASMARIKERLDGLSLEPPSHTREHAVGIEPPGLELEAARRPTATVAGSMGQDGQQWNRNEECNLD